MSNTYFNETDSLESILNSERVRQITEGAITKDEYHQFDSVMVDAYNRFLRDHEDYTVEDAYLFLTKIVYDRYQKFINRTHSDEEEP